MYEVAESVPSGFFEFRDNNEFFYKIF